MMRMTWMAGAAVVAALVGMGQRAEASFIATDATFFTLSTPGTLNFIFEGFSAADTNLMSLAINGTTIFNNKTATVGQTYSAVLGAGTYQLQLQDLSAAAIWSSDPSKNSDRRAHLVGTTNFADFNLGATAPVAAATYYGWEDRAFPNADGDFNDLVFAVTSTPTRVPEPMSLGLLGAGLAGLGWIRRRRA